LSLFMLGLGIIAWVSAEADLNLPMLPWEGPALRRMLPILGAAGIACVLLAGSRLRWIFPLWCLFVLTLMIRGFFLSSYSFAGANQFQFAVWLTAGALLAALGSLGVLRRRTVRR
jgi:hypothetical protein